ncbi:hypothetical protein [Rhizobium leguminosarum]|uniref:hypothetical protein n=1 Tax=Rhizobium leguminosarum TaxID=384 RepID=UPI0010325227|nr:hypothetical protein [Rhizobium leguminosarum]TAY13848.1 hypothetical protein ELH96_19750 [Rhizobium leguminosarum]
MTALGRYLSGTRIGCADLPGEEAKLLYGPIINKLSKTLVGTMPEKLDVAIVHTMNRYSEISRIADRPVLIYDRYAGQLLNTLTRILYWSQDVRTSNRFFSKVFAEQAILAGDLTGGMAGALAHVQFQKFWNIRPAGSDARVSLRVRLQEVFIFAHEFAHAMMTASEEFQKSTRAIGDLLTEPRDGPKDRGAYKFFQERYPGRQTFKQWKQLGEAEDAFVTDHRELLRDEVGCDDFALHMTLVTCLSMDESPEYAFEAAFLALRNIRALAYIRRDANPASSKLPHQNTTEFRLLQVRQHRLRDAFRSVAAVYSIEKALDGFWAKLQDLSDLHDRQIDYPLLATTLSSFKRVRRQLMKDKAVSQVRDVFEVAEWLGWDPAAKSVNYVLL